MPTNCDMVLHTQHELSITQLPYTAHCASAKVVLFSRFFVFYRVFSVETCQGMILNALRITMKHLVKTRSGRPATILGSELKNGITGAWPTGSNLSHPR